MGKLDGKVAIITGASRGIGKATALLFAREGAKIVGHARTMNEGDHRMLEGSLTTTAAEVEAAGGEMAVVQGELSGLEDCERLVEHAKATFGTVDVLVNNAAMIHFISVMDSTVSRWMRAFAVNIHAPFILSQAALPEMIERGRGAIINISSGVATGPGRGPYESTSSRPAGHTSAGNVTYGATKAALERFTQGLAEEMYEHGITVAAVGPSEVVRTEANIFYELVSGFDDERGEPTDMVARAALLLATEPLEKVAGRVCYSQQILKEFGWIEEARGTGVDPDQRGSGYAQI